MQETIKGFEGLVNGKYDDIPESAFYMVGTIEEALEKAKKLKSNKFMSLNLEIISPQKIFFNDEIDLCILPGVEGDFGNSYKIICHFLLL